MDNLKLIEVVGEPDAADRKIVTDGLLAHHAKQGHPRKPKEYFSVYIKNKEGVIVGGIIVSFLWTGMEIESLWVDESLRNNGWGRRLVESAENEARKRGCTVSYTNTFSWQSSGFYETLGYLEYGRLKDFPIGSDLVYYCKKLNYQK